MPVKLRAQWFVPVPSGGERDRAATTLCVAAGLRDLVAFRELNLFGTWPMKGCFQVIFCRNAAIYFEEAAQAQLWSRFAPKLAPGGALYLGHSERISGAAAQLFEAEGVTTYRLRGGRA